MRLVKAKERFPLPCLFLPDSACQLQDLQPRVVSRKIAGRGHSAPPQVREGTFATDGDLTFAGFLASHG
jgi:hypothetical protein